MKRYHFYYIKLKPFARQLRNNATWAEKRKWNDLLAKRNFHGYPFLRQKSIDKYIVDFYCKKLKLAIEVDGKIHEYVDVRKSDLKKEKRLRELGITVTRFSNCEVLNELNHVAELLEKEIFRITEGHPPNLA